MVVALLILASAAWAATAQGTASASVGAPTIDPAAGVPPVKIADEAVVIPEGHIVYQVLLTNPVSASDTWTNTVVIDTIDSSLRIDDVGTTRGTPSWAGQDVTVSIGDMSPGTMATVTISVTVKSTATRAYRIANTAYLSHSGEPSVASSEATTVVAHVGSYLSMLLRGHRVEYWTEDWRFGFGVVRNPIEQYDVSQLDADWYVNFGVRTDPPSQSGLRYIPTIRLSDTGYSPSQVTIVDYANDHPGTLWLIGNEPDAPAQDCVTPANYAQLYHELYHLIKGADPSAKIAIGGVVQATPLRLQYLDLILQEYQNRYGAMIPVDVWNVHGFILQEKADGWGCQIPCGLSATQGRLYTIEQHDDMTIFQQQIVAFRQWMANKGERDKPLIVSEYGILMPGLLGFYEPRVETVMLATFDYFVNTTSASLGYESDGNRLVQAWNWYSLDDWRFEGYQSFSHLFDPNTKQITDLGQAFADYTASVP